MERSIYLQTVAWSLGRQDIWNKDVLKAEKDNFDTDEELKKYFHCNYCNILMDSPQHNNLTELCETCYIGWYGGLVI